MNYLKTAVLLAALTGLLVAIGYAIGGTGGMVVAFGFACVMNFVSYWFSDKIVLTMYRAQPLPREQAPELHAIVEDLAARARMPVPPIYRIPQPSPNAFATGRSPSHAAVAVTDGILRLLDRRELRGVLAHELAHVKNRDVLTSSIAATIAGAISMIAQMAQFAMLFGGYGGRDDRDRGNPLGALLAMIVAPIAAMLIQLAISRSREYGADHTGAEVSEDPLALASALEKLERGAHVVPMDALPATAHLMIVNPFTAKGLAKLFSTHPPIQDRVERLRAMAGR